MDIFTGKLNDSQSNILHIILHLSEKFKTSYTGGNFESLKDN